MEQKGTSSSSSSPSSSRWNPTKEQIEILETLYKQGVRTPTAEQIQQITSRLREFGGTEGKNVFYWFQNHKARQRQKLKQERFAYYSRFLNPETVTMTATAPVNYVGHVAHPQPVNVNGLLHPQACNNVLCGPYCLQVPQVGGVGFYQPQYPNVFMPRTMQMSPNIDQDQSQRMELQSVDQQTNPNMINNAAADIETLLLFPLHPTGILEAERSGSSLTSASMDYSNHSGDQEGEEEGSENNNPPSFFNFFG